MHLTPSLVAALRAAAAHPFEVCGLIGGHIEGDAYYADHLIGVPNAHAQPEIAYEMARQEMVAAIWAIRRAGQEVVALYHSHPYSAPIPSESDIVLATWPDTVYLIVGYAAGDAPTLGGWLIRTGKIYPVPILIAEET